ncbi:MAG: peptidoglycan editing factor PgeF [Burkholderiales bacterium]
MSDALRRRLAAQGLDWIVPHWDGPPRVAALFTTRHGGAGEGVAGTMDVGTARPDAAALAGAVGANRARLRAFLPSDPVWLSQVHGRRVVVVDAANAPALRAQPPEADAAVTRTPGIALTVRTADCLPVLLAAHDGSVLGVAHAGWRGLAGGVLEATLATMDVPPATVCAWLGPAIGKRMFEVGDDVLAAFGGAGSGAARHFAPLRQGKWLADLPSLARARLHAAGVRRVAGGHWCTHSESARFFSYRRERDSGRMALVAWLADGQ